MRNFSGKNSYAVGAPPSMKIGLSGLVRGDGSVSDISKAGRRLLGVLKIGFQNAIAA
jgi:hypothetical protein